MNSDKLAIETFEVGDKVEGGQVFEGDPCKFSGTVVGHGIVHGVLKVLVALDDGEYLKNNSLYMYISTVVVCPENMRKV